MTEDSLTLDGIAKAARVTARTIRFYQARGALMPPEVRGRVAYYGERHLERLKLVAQLQDRGLRIDAIRDLLKSIDNGETDLAEWLGVERALQASWAEDHPRTVTEAELYELASTDRPGLIAELLEAGLLERRADVLVLVSPALLGVAMKLEACGVDLETSVKASSIARKHIGRAANDLVALFLKHAADGAVETADVAALFQALRPTGIEAMRVIFGREMEKALRKLRESGKMASLPAKARKARARKR